MGLVIFLYNSLVIPFVEYFLEKYKTTIFTSTKFISWVYIVFSLKQRLLYIFVTLFIS